MRTIMQPGPTPCERVQWVAVRAPRIEGVLEPGLSLLKAVHGVFAAYGLASGVLRLAGGAVGPFAYVMPALSATPRYAAFYSAAQRSPGPGCVRAGALT